MTSLKEQSQRKVLVLDGAMGTMIQRCGLSEAGFRGTLLSGHPCPLQGDNDVLVLTRPEIVESIHRSYLEAGADIIETDTFNSNRLSQAPFGLQDRVPQMNLEAARLALGVARAMTRQTPQQPRFVAGSIGPTGKSLSVGEDIMDPARRTVDFEDLFEAFLEQEKALLEGGVDALLVETQFDGLNAKAALLAARQAMRETDREVPLMLSVTVSDRSGRLLSGQSLSALLASVSGFGLFSFGLNCALGASGMVPILEELDALAPCLLSAYPNAGLPNSQGGYDQTPEMMAEELRPLLERGRLNIVGGCCGTTDRHIARISSLARQSAVRIPPPPSSSTRLGGLDVLELEASGHLTVVGERCNVTGSRRFLRLIERKAYSEALQIARDQVRQGARILDVNMDDGLLDARTEMVHFLRLMGSDPEISRVPVMVDSSSWEVVRAALREIQGKPVVNSISLKEGEETFLARAREIRELGAAVVVMAFDEKGQADTLQRRTEICARAYRLLTLEAGFPPQDIIFDPNVLAVATGLGEHDRYALDFIRSVEWIRGNLPGVHISGGVSNLSYAFRGNDSLRQAMHQVFLHHALKAGMDMAIMNPVSSVSYATIPPSLLEVLEDVILCRREDASSRLLEMASAMKECAAPSTAALETRKTDRRDVPVAERIAQSVLKGDTSFLQPDLMEALNQGLRAVDLIQGPLMAGMDRVGRLFQEGRMFLPEVVRTARVMKEAVDILSPYLQAARTGLSSRGKLVLATVKGDVHDIGKNIVKVVMSCNGFEVVDLGTMVPAEEIVSRAVQERADLVGLSGLITPSLAEMVRVAALMERRGLRIPLFIGGAATSAEHTALSIAPVYPHGLTVHLRDASEDPVMASRLLDSSLSSSSRDEILACQETIRKGRLDVKEDLMDLESARRNHLRLF